MKKVLIITYYWKPAGGPGVQRWLKFVKYLRDFGIEPIVYIPENPDYPIVDNEIGKDLPSDIRVISRPIWEPYRLASFFSKKKSRKISSGIIPRKNPSFIEKTMLWIRGNFFIPDARKFWIRPSVKFLNDFLEKEQIDTIITTAPPHSIHLIGLGLKEKNPNLRWLADFRDPWTNIGYHKDLRLTQKSQQKHISLEKKVLQTADDIIVTSFTTQEEFSQKTNRPIHIITNGYDTLENPKAEVSTQFSISHIGSLLSDRNPKVLWQVLAELVKENKEFAQDFELCLAGKVSDDIILEIEKSGLKKHLQLLGYLPHKEAIKLQQQSQILLLLEINREETQGIIPGKLFEYMVSDRPILAIGPTNWDAGKIIKQTNTGKVFEYSDYENIKKTILEYYQSYKKGNLKTFPIGLAPYSRRNLTKRLADIIQKS